MHSSIWPFPPCDVNQLEKPGLSSGWGCYISPLQSVLRDPARFRTTSSYDRFSDCMSKFGVSCQLQEMGGCKCEGFVKAVVNLPRCISSRYNNRTFLDYVLGMDAAQLPGKMWALEISVNHGCLERRHCCVRSKEVTWDSELLKITRN